MQIIGNALLYLELCSVVNTICQPLFQATGMNYFSYSICHKSGNAFSLGNNLRHLHHYYGADVYLTFEDLESSAPKITLDPEESLYVFFTEATMQCLQNSGTPDSVIEKNIKNIIVAKKLGITHRFYIVKKCMTFADPYYEFVGFGFPIGNCYEYCLSNIPLFKQFITIFKHHLYTDKLLSAVIQNKRYVVFDNNQHKSNVAVTNDIKNIPQTNFEHIKSVYVTPTLSLTKRQLEVGYLATRGHSAKEIAKILDLSFRTVEMHLSLVKEKTDAVDNRAGLQRFFFQHSLDDQYHILCRSDKDRDG